MAKKAVDTSPESREEQIRLDEIEAYSANGIQSGGYCFPYSFYSRHHLWIGD